MLKRRTLLALSALAGCRKGGQHRIAVVPKATAHLFFVSVHEGVDRAAAELKAEVLWNGPSDETDSTRQIQIVDSMIAQHVDGIVISATDERALVPPLQRASAAKIPVVIFDSAVGIEDYVSFIATDNEGAGALAARRLGALVGGKGEVAMVMQKPGGASTGLRERGFELTLQREYPEVKIVARQFSLGDRARARAAAENILTAHAGLAGVFASSEASSIGSIQALKARGLSGKTKLVTFDDSEMHREALQDGTIDLMLVQDPSRLGYEAVKAMAEHLQGRKPARRMDLPVREVRRG
ncbi:MAG: substrate-binding domain-containing protein [Acidobacteria bacterium]|nr:substrate-binding domain-containing protein [Acidobacteriota bacterium]